MQTTLDCLPCYLKQTLYTVRLGTDSLHLQKEILAAVMEILPSLDLSKSPPENSIPIYDLIAKLTGVKDPYANLKEKSNRQAIDLQAELCRLIRAADDPIRTAIKLAMAGNIIDYGAHQDFDVQDSINNCLTQEAAIDDYQAFSADLKDAENILYLADNCGELVFDGLLINEIKKAKNVTVSVKDSAIINDALYGDAITCGLDKFATIISNGTNCPGTPLASCSPEFLDKFHNADLIISKGQGNFETLSMEKPAVPLYFMLTIKCPVIATHAAEIRGLAPDALQNGDLLLMKL